MSETAEVLIQAVTPAEGNKPWKVKDGNGREMATFKAELGAQAQALVGQQARVTFSTKQTEKDGRVFVNTYLDAIEALAANGSEGGIRRSSADEPNVNVAKQVLIVRQNAWGQANQAYQTAARMLTDDPGRGAPALHNLAWLIVFGDTARPSAVSLSVLAHAIEARIRTHWLPVTSEEVPF